jgi:hypothetical protein
MGVFDMGQKPPSQAHQAHHSHLPVFDIVGRPGSLAAAVHFPLSLSWLAPHAPRFRFSSAWLWLRAARANLAAAGALARSRGLACEE